MANEIAVRIENGQWVAEFRGEQAAEIRRLFGTTTIPTPYTVRVWPQVVLAAIQERNPGMSVTITPDA